MNFTYPYRGTYSTDYRGGRGSAVERLLCKEDAKGSIPFDSTILKPYLEEPLIW